MIPCLAATFDSPILLPLLSTTGTPSWISLKFTIKIRNHLRHDNQKQCFYDKQKIFSSSYFILIMGTLTQLAAATAANGTKRPINAGAV
jgi:hypothetical protein